MYFNCDDKTVFSREAGPGTSQHSHMEDTIIKVIQDEHKLPATVKTEGNLFHKYRTEVGSGTVVFGSTRPSSSGYSDGVRPQVSGASSSTMAVSPSGLLSSPGSTSDIDDQVITIYNPFEIPNGIPEVSMAMPPRDEIYNNIKVGSTYCFWI